MGLHSVGFSSRGKYAAVPERPASYLFDDGLQSGHGDHGDPH